jgi:hypothetical protein
MRVVTALRAAWRVYDIVEDKKGRLVFAGYSTNLGQHTERSGS